MHSTTRRTTAGLNWLLVAVVIAGSARAEAPQAPDAELPADAADSTPAATDPADVARQQKFAAIKWQEGPVTGDVGTLAEIKLPSGYRFTGGDGARAFLELTGNRADSSDLALLMPEDGAWFMVFSFQGDGYVKDDDHGKLDADALLASLRAGNEKTNKYRASQGVPPLEIVGWAQPPAYDSATHNLCWAIKGRSPTGEVVNYNTRVLGRSGVMSINLVAEPEQLAQLVPTTKSLIAEFDYKQGQRYAEWKAGDKVAAYGLSALVAGGGLAVAAKTGLLAKLGLLIAKGGKAIIIGALALFAWLGKLFSGRKSRT